MRYIILYIIALAFFAGCTKKTDNLFEKTADERLNDALNGYQTALTGAPGWKLFVYPKGLEDDNIKVGGLTYYLRFLNNNRVSMVSDFTTAIAASPKESGYRIKALQRPSLIFDTYTYMHIPADPDPDVSFSPTGTGGNGWGTDFNFAFTETTIKDTFRLKGNFNKSEALLIKATQAEMDAAFSRGRLRDIMNFTFGYPASNPFLYFQASPSLRAGVGFNLDLNILTFTYLDGGNLVNRSIPFSFTINGIFLQTPVTIGSYTFQEMFWDEAKRLYYILSGTTRIELANNPVPIVTLSLTNVIGTQYKIISVPPDIQLPNQSPLFVSRHNLVKSGVNNPYNLTLDKIDFVFNNATKTMLVNAYVYQGPAGPFLCQYSYIYTIDGSGYYKFTKTGQNGNALFIVDNMNNILSFIESDQFKMDGFSTSSSFLGQFTSRQTPAFYFTGYLN